MVTWVRLGAKYLYITLLFTYQNLLKLVQIWRSSDKNKNAQFFFRHGV